MAFTEEGFARAHQRAEERGWHLVMHPQEAEEGAITLSLTFPAETTLHELNLEEVELILTKVIHLPPA